MKKKTSIKNLLFFGTLVLGAIIAFIYFPAKTDTNPTLKQNEYGTFTNPEVAYKECQKLLIQLSNDLNKGIPTNKTKQP
ncbi:hypothetical protein [Myroides odoratimimus]|uniref:hypothetical protein n=1 Tax=Myroides odoratimimus TaxID=76832 RepID=UPI002578F8E1|nr:hypothetical protein [Myroides odoratimimus]MDM1396456.1 hypothetical protein [Myroides odoratimimus]MDM1528969.1 hypothetical protein [Myroides odoratimimus]